MPKDSTKLTGKMISLIDAYFDPEIRFNKKKALAVAGYQTKNDSCYRVFAHPGVVAEIERRHGRVALKVECKEDFLIDVLMEMATADYRLAKFKKVDEEGHLYWDFTGATEKELGLVRSFVNESYTEGRGDEQKRVKKTKVETSAPAQAIDMLMRYMGLYKDKIEVAGSLDLVARLNRGRERMINGPVIDAE